MKTKYIILVITLMLMIVVSCDEPETVVTNIVHADGSVTRKIEMRSSKNKFETSGFQVPFDATWSLNDSIEINDKGDTTWVKRAEKLFKSADEINLTYLLDSGANKSVSREVMFTKRFRWFNTEYRFSENIDKTMESGYPVSDFLTAEELHYFYSPDYVKGENALGPDSVKYKILDDSVSKKTDKWITRNLIAVWIVRFSKLVEARGGTEVTLESLKSHEDDIFRTVDLNSEKFDSLWDRGIILKNIIGESMAIKYKVEADSAVSLVLADLMIDFKDYSVGMVMPGKLTDTNGFIDSSKVLMWPVKSDYFLTEPYEMWVESKVPNIWAWTVSAIFVGFVLTGVVIRIKKKG